MTASSSGSAGLAATAEQHLAAGDLAAALAALQQQVRRQPGDARLRIFLFQLLVLLQARERAGQIAGGDPARRVVGRGRGLRPRR